MAINFNHYHTFQTSNVMVQPVYLFKIYYIFFIQFFCNKKQLWILEEYFLFWHTASIEHFLNQMTQNLLSHQAIPYKTVQYASGKTKRTHKSQLRFLTRVVYLFKDGIFEKKYFNWNPLEYHFLPPCIYFFFFFKAEDGD